MKKLDKVLDIVNLVLIILFSVHLMGGWILGWLFDALFFNPVWYVLLLSFTLGFQRWVQVFTQAPLRDRVMSLISALLLTAVGIHMIVAGVDQAGHYHDDSPVCIACIYDIVPYYEFPVMIWAMVRLVVMLLDAPAGKRLALGWNLGIFTAWFGYGLVTCIAYVAKHGWELYGYAIYYGGRVFVPLLMIINVVLFLTRNVRETVQLLKE